MDFGGLALGVGMLVDNSIVVLESIFRCRAEGDELLEPEQGGGAAAPAAAPSSSVCLGPSFLVSRPPTMT